MASCSAFGSSSEVTLWYAEDQEVADSSDGLGQLADGDPIEWLPINITGESISTNLSSAVSEQITANRSYAGSKLTQGEVSGSFNYEMQASSFIYDMLISVLQANKTAAFEGTTNWAGAEGIKNGSTKHCFAILKRVAVASGNYDWYVFRGVQASSMTCDISPNALLTGTVNIMGVRPDTPIEAAATVTGWTFATPENLPLMSGVDSLKNFAISAWDGAQFVETDVTMQSVTINFDNQLRQQQAVGINTIYAAGVASGRFRATYSGSAYYADPKVYNAFVNDTTIRITGQLVDSDGDGLQFDSGFVKVTSGAIPMAGGPDQDLMISTEFQAFEDTTPVTGTGTVTITKITTA